ncbi:hypothetical protein [Deinococcus aquatilis]|uniref:hypothetical protein n=1 Tax=Deinococcus aquatilis TaxID=519440 RepID=UPI00037DAAEC|nr:hypothetical protein [Deinococcus aquatilis]
MKRLPESYLNLWNQYLLSSRPLRPLLMVAGGSLLFMVGVNVGRMLYSLTQGG